MRKRPISIAILAGFFLLILIPNLLATTDPSKVPGTNSLGWSTEAIQIARSALCVATAVFAVGLLRGKTWARTGFIVSLFAEIARIVLLGRSMEKSLLVVEILLVLLAIWVLYRQRGRDFFSSDRPTQSLIAQCGSAVCHGLTTYLIMISIGMSAGWVIAGEKAVYMVLLFSAFAAASFGIGRRLGWILSPRPDLGTMLLVASVACMLPLIAELGRGAVDDPGTRLYMILTMALGSTFSLIGVFLVRQSREQIGEIALLPAECDDVTREV